VFASVAKTGRLVVAHEAVQVGGFGAEVAATVAEHCFKDLKAPVRRLGSPRVPIAYAPPLEDMLRVTPDKIAEAARGLAAA
jgi:pyruvate dehydrogenase E1 component beta subunit